ncbi:MAG TPA: PEP-CTERM sorting domain-containing protein [Gemmataceae bacterium]
MAIGLAQAAAAQPVVLYSANFNSPTYADGPLVNPPSATDTTTPGQDGWLSTNAGLTNQIPVSNSATNGFVSLTTSGQDVRHQFTAVNSGSVFFDADVTVSAAQATGDYALHLSDGGTSLFYARTYFQSSGTGFHMALGTSAGTTGLVYGPDLAFGTTYHVLARYDFVSGTGNNDTGALYINPTTVDGSGDTPYVAATLEGTDATSIAAIALRQGTAANSATLTVDNYRAFVMPVPEPSSLALLGIPGVAVVIRRFRRKAA